LKGKWYASPKDETTGKKKLEAASKDELLVKLKEAEENPDDYDIYDPPADSGSDDPARLLRIIVTTLALRERLIPAEQEEAARKMLVDMVASYLGDVL
jgi:hypothetical protein